MCWFCLSISKLLKSVKVSTDIHTSKSNMSTVVFVLLGGKLSTFTLIAMIQINSRLPINLLCYFCCGHLIATDNCCSQKVTDLSLKIRMKDINVYLWVRVILQDVWHLTLIGGAFGTHSLRMSKVSPCFQDILEG